ncbi:MAG: YhgN family NAAT transporter [Pseudomonadota bacterium]
MDLWSAALLLFLIMDPLGNVPLFLSLLKDLPPRRRRVVLARELLIALGVLFAFLFGGRWILELLQLKQEAVSIAGGIILFLIGIKMIFPSPEGLFGETPGGEPFIVPMAIPLVAGPSTVAVLQLLGGQDPGRLGEWSLALLLAWAGTAAILFSSTTLYRWLGLRTLTAVEKLMGMLLVALSVQMLLDGVAGYLGRSAGAL